MELIEINSEMKEVGPIFMDIDFEVGDSSALNNFELYANSAYNAYGVYIPETEFGGIIEYDSNISTKNESTLRGWTWRGLLSQWIIEPENGNDYKTVSGEMNTILRELLRDVLGGFFCVPEIDSGITVNEYQFKRYCSVLDGLADMTKAYDCKLKIYGKRTSPGSRITVFCEAIPIKKIEGTYDEDTGLELQFKNNRMGINHLICLGKGELKERQRVDLYLSEDGTIGESKSISGFEERQGVYDYSSTESIEELKESGIKRLKEIANSKSLDINEVSNVDLDVGDIIVGRKNDIGMIIEKPIVRKIYRIQNGEESIEYKVKGEG